MIFRNAKVYKQARNVPRMFGSRRHAGAHSIAAAKTRHFDFRDGRAMMVYTSADLSTASFPDMTQAQGSFTAGPLTFVVKHELWDENIQDHADQGVAICVTADVVGRPTTLLRFNCFDIERSYIYGPENTGHVLAGPDMLGGAPLTNLYRMDPIACGNPIGWTVRTLESKLLKMLYRAGYPAIAKTGDGDPARRVLPGGEG